MKRSAVLVLLAWLAAPGEGAAQALRSMVVPGDSVVVIAPRGQPAPAPTPLRMTPASPPAAPIAAAPVLPTATFGAVPLAPAVGMLLPLAAAVLFSGTLPGSGSGTSAPATTR